MANSVAKKIYYRKAEIINCSQTLEELLSLAMTQVRKASERQESINDSESEFRLINRYTHYNKFFTAQMVQVEQGASQPVVIYDESDEEYQLAGVNPSDLNLDKKYQKARKDFVNSMLYFGVRDNHVIVMTSRALNFRALESHLQWLLAERCQLVNPESLIVLKKEFPAEFKEMVAKHPVKSVEIGSAISYDTESRQDVFVDTFSFAIVKAVFGSLIEKLKDKAPESILESSNLQAKLVLSYKRKTDEDGQRFLNHLGTNLRHIEDTDIKVNLAGCGELTNGELNLCKTIQVGKTNDGLLIMSEISYGMQDWLNGLARSEGIMDND